jgi:hypothetical protein
MKGAAMEGHLDGLLTARKAAEGDEEHEGDEEYLSYEEYLDGLRAAHEADEEYLSYEEYLDGRLTSPDSCGESILEQEIITTCSAREQTLRENNSEYQAQIAVSQKLLTDEGRRDEGRRDEEHLDGAAPADEAEPATTHVESDGTNNGYAPASRRRRGHRDHRGGRRRRSRHAAGSQAVVESLEEKSDAVMMAAAGSSASEVAHSSVLSPDALAHRAPAALTRCPPGTFRWIIEDDGQRELLVIDACLMPGELVRYAKMAVSTFVFPTKYAMKVDELIVSMEDELTWTSGCWPPGSLAEYAITARIPAGTFANVWAASENGNWRSMSRCVVIALCICAEFIQPLEHPEYNINRVLCHDDFQRLVDEAGSELDRAREAWEARREKVQQGQVLAKFC